MTFRASWPSGFGASRMNMMGFELAGGVVLRLPDELDLLGYLSLAEQIDDLLRDGKKHVLIDLELVTYVSSSVSRALVALHERARSAGGSVMLAGCQGGARVALDTVGALAVLPNFETVQEAISSVGEA